MRRSRTTELRNAEVEKLAMSALIYYVRLNKGRLFPEELFSDIIQLIDERLGASKPPVAPEGHFADVSSEVISVVLSTDKAAQNAAMLLQARLRFLVARRKEVVRRAVIELQAAVRGQRGRKQAVLLKPMASADERAANWVKRGRVKPMLIQLPDEIKDVQIERQEDSWHLARQATKKAAVVTAIFKSSPGHMLAYVDAMMPSATKIAGHMAWQQGAQGAEEDLIRCVQEVPECIRLPLRGVVHSNHRRAAGSHRRRNGTKCPHSLN